ncbi:MAG TPA: hemolysin III family protein [Actinomycetota bacterium]|jgi:hemolysin III|nr:hemolysin III family protein [Actinomycetota bacterium]
MGDALPILKPRLRGRIHQVAFFVSVPAGALLVLLANGAAATAVAIIYAVSLSAVLGSSAAYHRGAWSERARRWMKRLDHSMIFVLIAASYTPVAALVLGGPWEVVLLSVVWAGAVVGITMKLARPDGLRVPTAVLYMVLGWLVVVVFPQLLREMSTAEASLLVAGGLLYTAGAIVFASRRPDPRPSTFGYHEIWHAFMVAAAACHYVMILLVLLAS